MDKPSRKGKSMNVPIGGANAQNPGKKGGKLGKNGQVFQNDLLKTDFTRQDMGTVRSLRK